MLKKHKLDFKNIFLVIIGSIIVSFGNLGFLSVLDINSGGLNGVAIIVRYFVNDPEMKALVYDTVIAVASIVLWVIGFIFISKKFAFRTLVATLAFPAANFAFTYIPGLNTWVSDLAKIVSGDGQVGNMIICALFGGIFSGAGVAITFLGDGSTGGVDVLTILLKKYLHIKQSIGGFIVDGTIILLGVILLPMDKFLVPCLCGIVSSFVCAVLIDFIFVGSQTSFQADVISDKWEEISRFAQDELGRGATIIHANGGYKNEDRIILRVVFERHQLESFKDFVAVTDPSAFITITQTNAVYGEGFNKHELSSMGKIKQKKNKKDGK